MAPPSSLVNKLKVQLKLSISRLRMIQQKDSAKAKQQRREMAQLLEAGKTQSARIRVENIIRSDITTELHEILELYCELVLARSQLLEYTDTKGKDGNGGSNMDPALEEAVRSLIYAAPRTEVKELHAARALLVEKFGKEVLVASMEGEGVAERVLKKLKVESPREELVDAYLTEIARFYGVPYGEAESAAEDAGEVGGEEEGDDDDEPGDGEKELAAPLTTDPLSSTKTTGKSKDAANIKGDDQDLATSTPHPPKEFGPTSPLRIVPPSPSTDNVAPKVKVPGPTGVTKLNLQQPKANVSAQKKAERPGGTVPSVDDLAKRFASLKR